MKAMLFIIAGSCFLFSCKSISRAVAYIDKISTPPAASAAPATQSTDYAPAVVDGKSLEIGKPNVTKFYWECEFNVGANHAHYSGQNAEYIKTGTNTAKVKYVTRGESGVFNLKFTGRTGGVVVGEGVSFTLK